MAPVKESIVCVPTAFNSEILRNQSINCQLCVELSLELHKAQQELLSCGKVIQILREELANVNQRARPDAYNRNQNIHILEDHYSSPKQPKEWQQVPFTTRKVKPTRNYSPPIPLPTQNKFDPLTNLKENDVPPSLVQLSNPKLVKVKKPSAPKHKVLIFGDSHARDSASRLQPYLGDNYSVTSFVKPGAPMEEILTTADELRTSVRREDILIVWGGSNNISKNNTQKAISSVSDFAKNNSGSNIILINAPHRHDLIPHSCVNKEVVKYNRLMKKVVKQYPNIQLLDLDLDRSHFTTHGMHMNSKGKNRTSQCLADLIDLIFDQPQPSPIPIPWELTSPALSNTDSYHTDKQVQDISVTQLGESSTESTIPQQAVSQTGQTDPLIQAKEPNRMSSRQKKPPQSKLDDFLWYAPLLKQKVPPN